MMEVVILSGADADLDEIYSRIEETGGGAKFLLSVDRKLELLRTFPRMAGVGISGKVRKVKVGRPTACFMPSKGDGSW